MSVTGVRRTTRNMDKLKISMAKAAYEGVSDALDQIMRLSQKLVPVDQTDLRRSGVLIDMSKKTKVKIMLRYGGGSAAAYAVRQHEDLTLRHKPGKSAKFLERPAKAIAGMAVKIISKPARRVVKGALGPAF